MRHVNYQQAEDNLVKRIAERPDFITKSTYEVIQCAFTLLDPTLNRNNRSNYEYAEKFFEWLLTGEKEISPALLNLNPWVKRFVDTAGLPDNFSSSYGWKVKHQETQILSELQVHNESRRAFFNILSPADAIVLQQPTTHEYPCTIGFQLFIRDGALHMVVNMRSNNVWSVMPYDVYNFTCLQQHYAELLKLPLGFYHHQINSAHLYKGDVRRYKESQIK